MGDRNQNSVHRIFFCENIIMEAWYLVSHKAGRNNLFRAQLSIQHRHLNLFSPQIRILRPRADRPGHRRIIEPLFCGYLFIELDPEMIHPVKIEEECAGISHFVRHGNEIRPIPDSIIDDMMALPLCGYAEDRMKSRRQLAREKKQRLAHRRHTCPDPDLVTQRIREIISQPDPDNRTAMFLALTEGLSRRLMKEAS